MNDIVAIQEPAEAVRIDPPAPAAPRIYYASPLLCGALGEWPSHLDRVAQLGFDHLLIAPPFAPGRTGDQFLAADFNRLHPALEWEQDAETGLLWLAGQCRARGLRLLLDVVPDRLAAGGAAARGAGDLFVGPEAASALDPRHGHGGSEAARARFGAPDLLAWWVDRLSGWAEAGVAGFRLLRLSHPPAAFTRDLRAGLRNRAPECLMLGWTIGLSPEETAGLEGSGLDLVSSSLPWWDFEADWLWTEARRLTRVGPLLTAPEAPFAERLFTRCHDPATREALYRRALTFAASLGSGWLMPMGFELGAAQPLDPARDAPEDWRTAEDDAPFDLSAAVTAANAARKAEAVMGAPAAPLCLTGSGAPVTAVLRTDAADARFAERGLLIVANRDAARHATAPASALLAASGGFPRLTALLPAGRGELDMADTLTLEPAEVVVFHGLAARPKQTPRPPLTQTAKAAAERPRFAVENVAPNVDGGAFPVKRVAGERVDVEADVIIDGHELAGVAMRWRERSETEWRERRMRPLGNDRWTASFPLEVVGTYEFVVEAWRDAFATWRDEVAKKHAAGVSTTLELKEGVHLAEEAAQSAPERLRGAARALADRLAKLGEDEARTLLLSSETAELMAGADPRPFAVTSAPLTVQADRIGAQFASWYEIFPRSMSDDPNRHGTFADVTRHLPRIRDMGFDVLYFPPIHPIGLKNRKGRNNSLKAAPDDVGSPYAIGGAEGGHDALHPALGTFDDFRKLREAAAEHGMELAIDFAIQCSPDHPWLKEHKDWFAWRPDGTIKYAENPPKKYEDIVNVDFYAEGAVPGLWVGLCDVITFWAEQGVRLFRVDNPHTKPFPFWEWMIAEVRARFPDAIFLAEAFTRPKVMYRLAKIGFSQSYTYFTWRNTKAELTEYLTELNSAPPRDFFRPHFFVNTPDINPVFLQSSGRPGFLIRAALAATLSGLWGVYCGFELCEGTPLPGREEYLDSEKYQIRAWDWNRPGNIVGEITQLNEIRRTNPALHTHLGLTFLNASDDSILFYEKATPGRSNVLLIAVSLDPRNARESAIEVPLWKWGLPDHGSLAVEDLARGGRSVWTGKIQRVRLDPSAPYAIWRVRPAP